MRRASWAPSGMKEEAIGLGSWGGVGSLSLSLPVCACAGGRGRARWLLVRLGVSQRSAMTAHADT